MPPCEKQPPDIIGEEDLPFDRTLEPVKPGDPSGKKPAKEKDAENRLENKKFSLGSTTLGWCIALMVGCILLSIKWPESELAVSGFEAFKLIVMTILGYMFGSNTTK